MKPNLRIGSRTRILAGILLVVAAIFVLRLFYLQIIQNNHYRELAMQEQLKRNRIPATRGEIFLMNGSTPAQLVMNETVYTVFVDPAVITDTDEVATVMKAVAGGNVRNGFEALLEKKQTRYQIIATKVTRVQADKIKEHKLKGVGFQAVSQRVYPENGLAGQVLGFVNNEGKGNYGVEGYLNKELAGVDGRLETVTDVSDVPLTIGNRNIKEPAQNGKDVVLTIDRSVQSHVEKALAEGVQRTGATEASAVVMDPKTGKVLAMANVPTYEPGKFTEVKQEDISVFNNGAISSIYEPGSTTKLFTMATAINQGVARATDTYVNTDKIKVEDIVIENLSKGRTGTITFQTAMNWSHNTGFVTLGQRLGNGTTITKGARDTMYDYFHNRFHLGQATGIELANESSAGIVSPDSPDGEGNEVRYSNMTFGQGMNATALQMAAGFCAVVNGGNYYKPTVINGYMENGVYRPNASPEPLMEGVISKSTSDQMRAMAEESRRTNYNALHKQGYEIGGKTGTSQVPTSTGGYSNTETIASYLGYGGAENDPKYVIMVKIYGKNKVLEGAQDALPIFADISNWMLDYLKVQPKG